MDARRQLENTLDSRAAALGGGGSGSFADDDRAAKAVDKAVAKLVGDVDSARNEVDELKRAREADLRDARLAQKKLEQQVETCVEINQVRRVHPTILHQVISRR